MRHRVSGRLDRDHPTRFRHHAASRHAARLCVGRRAALAALVAAAIAVVAAGSPGVALASSLLSGYGGPGEGSEAILGSALVNGPSGGAGGGAAGGGGGSPASAAVGSVRGATAVPDGEHPALPASGSTGARGTGALGTGARGTGRRGEHVAGTGAAVAGAGSRGTALATQDADRGVVESDDLGLTPEDLVYVLLVLGALAAVWALTARLTRTGADETFSGAKGTALGTRLKP